MKKKILLIALCLAVVLGAGVGAYLADYYHASETAVAALRDPTITVETDGSATWFLPENPTAGLLFYPGGKVQCQAYAPLLRDCARRGIACALVQMPGNLAVLNPNAASGLTQTHPEISRWYIGGHSLGGAMAASYAAGHSGELEGVILLAAYSTKDLSQTGLRVLSLYGSEDGVLNRDSYEKNRKNLPQGYEEFVINGGCHAYFGDYGAQAGDGTPTIPCQEQTEITADYIASFIG